MGLFLCLRSAPAEKPELSILNADYPRAFFFTTSSSKITQYSSTAYADWEPAFNRLSGIMGLALDSAISRPLLMGVSVYFNRFKQEHPDQLVMLHFNGPSQDPCCSSAPDFSAGHWIYYAAANISSNVPAQTNDTVIYVSSTNHFEMDIGRYADWLGYPDINSDIVLYNLKEDGTPDWENCEQVKLLAVNGADRTITVQRGCYNTTPKAFTAGSARAAAHEYDGPWSQDMRLLWEYNFSTACPTNPQGKTCADVLVEELASKFSPDGLLSGFDGIEFDAAWNNDEGTSSGNIADMNNDQIADGGIINGINIYGIGVIEFYQKLKAALGKDKLILADGGSYLNQRSVGVLNGIESEAFPTIQSDTNAVTWETGLNFQRFAMQNASPPALSYINYRSETNLPFGRHRLCLAGAVCIGTVITWSHALTGETNDPIGVAIWDEVKKGVEKQTGWLGRPQGDMVRPALQTPNLLAGGFTTNTVVSNGYRFATQAITCASNDLLVLVRASGAPLTGHPATYARLLRAYISPTPLIRPLLGASPHYVPASLVCSNEFESAFYFRDLTNANVNLTLEFEGTNAVTIHSIAAYGGPDAMYRVFEHGLVLANPSFSQTVTFDLQAITPGRTYRRLQGSEHQDPVVNNGTAVGSQIDIGPRDGLFLIRTDN